MNAAAQRINPVVLLLMLCVASLTASAQTDSVPAHIRVELPDAKLSGQGSFRWFGLKIYDATLWVSSTSSEPLSGKFVLNLRYVRELYGDRIAQASVDEIRQLGLGNAVQQQNWLEKMQALFPNVNDGSQISGVYLPQAGARFYLDGKLLGEIQDAEFARAFFAIWLDPRTSANRLRSQLLGQS